MKHNAVWVVEMQGRSGWKVCRAHTTKRAALDDRDIYQYRNEDDKFRVVRYVPDLGKTSPLPLVAF